jgi:hypothetical protein
MLTVALPPSSFARERLLSCAELISELRSPALLVVGLQLLVQVDEEWADGPWQPAATTEAQFGALHVSAAAFIVPEVFSRLR